MITTNSTKLNIFNLYLHEEPNAKNNNVFFNIFIIITLYFNSFSLQYTILINYLLSAHHLLLLRCIFYNNVLSDNYDKIIISHLIR